MKHNNSICHSVHCISCAKFFQRAAPAVCKKRRRQRRESSLLCICLVGLFAPLSVEVLSQRRVWGRNKLRKQTDTSAKSADTRTKRWLELGGESRRLCMYMKSKSLSRTSNTLHMHVVKWEQSRPTRVGKVGRASYLSFEFLTRLSYFAHCSDCTRRAFEVSLAHQL
jgi:hypothetical protein